MNKTDFAELKEKLMKLDDKDFQIIYSSIIMANNLTEYSACYRAAYHQHTKSAAIIGSLPIILIILFAEWVWSLT